MTKRRIYTDRAYAHFVTFSCFKRRRLLQAGRSKKIMIAMLGEELGKHDGCCIGFVMMPNHVHALVWFPDPRAVSPFMNKWKDRSSRSIQTLYRDHFPNYWSKVGQERRVWQARYYDFNVDSPEKVQEKLDYMHSNPVRAELVARPEDWPFSSARHYLSGKSVGVTISAPEGAFG